VTKNALLKKLDTVMAEAESTNMWGEINIIVRDGKATVLRTMRSEQLDPKDTEKNSYDNHHNR
jgi:hypothetical protein